MSVYDAVLQEHKGDAAAALLGFLEFVKDKEAAAAEVHTFAKNLLRPETVEVVDKNLLVSMPVVVSPSAEKALEKAKAAQAEKAAEAAEEDSADIPIGRECLRQGCSMKYEGPESLNNTCVHHPGHAVFHETYKYWSCCDRNKKYDFDEFRAIRGCRDGPETCAFTRAAAGMPKKAPCRHDFFQVGSNVTVNIYAKKVDPEKSTFLISRKQLRVKIFFDFGKEFTLYRELPGEVEPSQCKVEIKEPKIEITLRKGSGDAGGVKGAAWPSIGTEIEE